MPSEHTLIMRWLRKHDKRLYKRLKLLAFNQPQSPVCDWERQWQESINQIHFLLRHYGYQRDMRYPSKRYVDTIKKDIKSHVVWLRSLRNHIQLHRKLP